MHCKIITEESVTFVNKLSVVAPCCKIIAGAFTQGGVEANCLRFEPGGAELYDLRGIFLSYGIFFWSVRNFAN